MKFVIALIALTAAAIGDNNGYLSTLKGTIPADKALAAKAEGGACERASGSDIAAGDCTGTDLMCCYIGKIIDQPSEPKSTSTMMSEKWQISTAEPEK